MKLRDVAGISAQRLNIHFHVITLGLLLVLMVATTCGSPSQTLSETLPLAAPAQARSGEPIQVLVGPVRTNDGYPVRLMVVGLHGATVYNSEFEDGFAHFDIAPQHTQSTGYLALIAIAGDSHGEASIILSTRRNAAM